MKRLAPTNTARFGALLALVLGATVAAGLLMLLETKPAEAAFPGANGKIFGRRPSEPTR